mmetsp:Transcript_171097/g.415918  ORF Transcript_171097/g.415918 Transcript_171097/m.415918 type:complete len:112 (+) Transcript_171097:92-427(+)
MNALRTRASGAVLAAARLPCARPTAVRALSGGNPLKDRESALENMYFNKEDERLMRQLLRKMKVVSDKHDEHGAVGVQATEMSALKEIVDKYKMANADIDALIEWRHNHSF